MKKIKLFIITYLVPLTTGAMIRYIESKGYSVLITKKSIDMKNKKK